MSLIQAVTRLAAPLFGDLFAAVVASERRTADERETPAPASPAADPVPPAGEFGPSPTIAPPSRSLSNHPPTAGAGASADRIC